LMGTQSGQGQPAEFALVRHTRRNSGAARTCSLPISRGYTASARRQTLHIPPAGARESA